jgi:hypothetical protein
MWAVICGLVESIIMNAECVYTGVFDICYIIDVLDVRKGDCFFSVLQIRLLL